MPLLRRHIAEGGGVDLPGRGIERRHRQRAAQRRRKRRRRKHTVRDHRMAVDRQVVHTVRRTDVERARRGQRLLRRVGARRLAWPARRQQIVLVNNRIPTRRRRRQVGDRNRVIIGAIDGTHILIRAPKVCNYVIDIYCKKFNTENRRKK